MLDEERALVTEAARHLSGVDASSVNRVALAELRRHLDSLEAEYERLAAAGSLSHPFA